MGINARNLTLLLATIFGSSLLLTASWGSSGDAVFPPVTHGPTKEECSACHMAYPAGLLPARSWKKMMGELDRHFGEDASLTREVASGIEVYLTQNAADSPHATMMMSRIASGIPGNSAPQRFTETRYFGYLHDEVPTYVWKRKGIASKANCVACHTKAEAGSFIEREIKIPKQ
ncbi:MAG: diheme cytochrome c [Hydrogenophilaceae bacterium]|nr:diheme cytochrome c [Hydrogenophilaceae bacterium]